MRQYVRFALLLIGAVATTSAAHGQTTVTALPQLGPGESLGKALGLSAAPNLRDLGGYKTADGRTVVRDLLQGPPFKQLAAYLPASELDRPIWITVRASIAVQPGEPGRKRGQASVELIEFNLGRQPIGSWPFSVVMGSAGAGLLKWPVPGTVMVEPPEGESRAELDRFCDAMVAIRKEISEVEAGRQPREGNVLKHAPHTAEVVTADGWDRPYSRETAAFPAPWVHGAKFWPRVARIDNTWGDRNLFCTCPPFGEGVE